MKKTLSLILVLLLVAPITGFACGCCGHGTEPPAASKGAGIHQASENAGPCCSTLELQRDPGQLQNSAAPVSSPQTLSAAHEPGIHSSKILAPRPETSPPLFVYGGFLFSGPPLYLWLQTLLL